MGKLIHVVSECWVTGARNCCLIMTMELCMTTVALKWYIHLQEVKGTLVERGKPEHSDKWEFQLGKKMVLSYC